MSIRGMYQTGLLAELKAARNKLHCYGAVPSLLAKERGIMCRMLFANMTIPDRGFEIEDAFPHDWSVRAVLSDHASAAESTPEKEAEIESYKKELQIEREFTEANNKAARRWLPDGANRRIIEKWLERHPNPQLEALLGEKFPIEAVRAFFDKEMP
jgi:hypothetical protein